LRPGFGDDEDSDEFWADVMNMTRELNSVCRRKTELENELRQRINGSPIMLVHDHMFYIHGPVEEEKPKDK